MNLTQLQLLLQGLCAESDDGLWKYAVLWSLTIRDGHPILTWGEGYARQVCDGHNNKNEAWCKFDQGHPLSIEAAIRTMSNHSYSLGEELVGKVAVTGHHRWISAHELSSTTVHKYHQDWQLQFTAGIKTVLLVPVIHHGVLQLGSLDTVLESVTLVALIKDLFHKLYNSPTIPRNSVYSNTLRKPCATPSADAPDVLPHDLFDLIRSSAQLLSMDHLSIPHPFTMSGFPVLEDATTVACNTGLTACPDETLDATENDLWTNVHEESSQLTHRNAVFEPDMANMSFMDKLTNLNTQLSCRSVINTEQLEYDNIYGFTLTGMVQGYQENTHGSSIFLDDDAVTSNCTELNKYLEAMSMEELEDSMWHCRLKQGLSTCHYSLLQIDGGNPDFHPQLGNNDYTE